jgi:hypothetical protein
VATHPQGDLFEMMRVSERLIVITRAFFLRGDYRKIIIGCQEKIRPK